MSTSRREEAQAAWGAAEALAELCALGERFLSGELTFFPGWGSPSVDEETDDLLPHLIALNRAGWFTLASQPGARNVRLHDGAPEQQRAFVTGFATARVAERMAALALESELCIAVFAPGERGGYRTPVTVSGTEPRVFAGHCPVDEEIECLRGHCSDAALVSLAQAHYACAIDLAWGRDDYLWTKLIGALRDVQPARSSGS